MARPGERVRGSTTGRPIMAALDLFGRRWTLRIVWELRNGPVGFRPLQERCDGMSSSVLRQRLVELVEAGLVRQGDDGRYGLSALGEGAREALLPLTRWSQEWAAALEAAAPEKEGAAEGATEEAAEEAAGESAAPEEEAGPEEWGR